MYIRSSGKRQVPHTVLYLNRRLGFNLRHVCLALAVLSLLFVQQNDLFIRSFSSFIC